MSVGTARAHVKALINQHMQRRAKEFQGTVKELHRNAPRGGDNLNRYGEPRSAPGEPPAMETGTLFAKVDQGLTREGDAHYRVQANYRVLEDGTRRLRPRPLARLALAEFKVRVRTGQ